MSWRIFMKDNEGLKYISSPQSTREDAIDFACDLLRDGTLQILKIENSNGETINLNEVALWSEGAKRGRTKRAGRGDGPGDRNPHRKLAYELWEAAGRPDRSQLRFRKEAELGQCAALERRVANTASSRLRSASTTGPLIATGLQRPGMLGSAMSGS